MLISNQKLHSNTNSPGACIHRHEYKDRAKGFIIYSSNPEIDWFEFLEGGIVPSSFQRFTELSYDEFGVGRVVRDFSRWYFSVKLYSCCTWIKKTGMCVLNSVLHQAELRPVLNYTDQVPHNQFDINKPEGLPNHPLIPESNGNSLCCATSEEVGTAYNRSAPAFALK